MISFTCPKCDRKLHGKEEMVGKQVKCPTCAQVFAIPMAAPVRASAPVPTPGENGNTLRLELTIKDQEVIGELQKFNDGQIRNEFALSALKIGVLTLRQASGIIDSQVVRHEGEKIVDSLREVLTANATRFHDALSTTLQKYFDPNDGDLPQRFDRLVRNGGELQSVLALHLDGNDSTIARTLAKHIGEQSPLFRILSPNQSDGLQATLTQSIQQALNCQRDHILKQFSLDDKESCALRLISELGGANGRLRADLSDDLNKLTKEFSLDNKEGALCRLVTRVDRAQQTIADQFSQDNENSALNRLSGLIKTANSSIESRLTLDDENLPFSLTAGIAHGHQGYGKRQQ